MLDARRPVLRHLLRQPAARPGARASAPTSCGTATAASTSRCWTGATGRVEVTAHNHGFAVDAPLDGPFDTPYGRRRGQPRLPQRRRASRGCAAGRARRSPCSTTPRPRPARTTPAYLFDRFGELMERTAGREPDAAAARTSPRPGDRLRADRHRPGLRVRLLGHPGLPGAARRGLRVILVNSNPATIMTDPEFADATYVEPITPEVVEKIIAKERPDALLATLGGQTALNTAIALHEAGVLEQVRRRADRRQTSTRSRRARTGSCSRRSSRSPPIGLDAECAALGRSATPWTSAWPPPASSATRWWCGRPSPWAAPGPGIAYDEADLRRIAGAGPARQPRPPRCCWRSRSSAGRSTSWS